MNLIWQKVAFIACLGFTALMAGANLAHMTATANGAPVPLLGFEIPHKTIMAVGAVCVDVIIIISPFALRYRHVNGQHTAFFVVLSLWLGCSLVSIQSVHDWLAESAQATAAPAVSAERQYHDLKTTLDESRVRLKSIKEKLLKEEDYGKRRILLNEEKRQKDDIDVMEKKFWQAQVVPMPKPDDMEHWVKAVILWALSVGCWVGFLGDEGGDHPSKNTHLGDSVVHNGVTPPQHRPTSDVDHPNTTLKSYVFHVKPGDGPVPSGCHLGDAPVSPQSPTPPPRALAVVGGTDYPITQDGYVMERKEQPAIDQWVEKHTSPDATCGFRPSDAWASFVENGYAKGYVKEVFFSELKGKMPNSWKRTKMGVFYQGYTLT